MDKKESNCTYKIQYPIFKLGKDSKYDGNIIRLIGKIFVDDFTKLESYDNEFEQIMVRIHLHCINIIFIINKVIINCTFNENYFY